MSSHEWRYRDSIIVVVQIAKEEFLGYWMNMNEAEPHQATRATEALVLAVAKAQIDSALDGEEDVREASA